MLPSEYNNNCYCWCDSLSGPQESQMNNGEREPCCKIGSLIGGMSYASHIREQLENPRIFGILNQITYQDAGQLPKQLNRWQFAQRPLATPNRPKPPQSLIFQEKQSLPRTALGIATEFILCAIQSPTEFYCVALSFSEFPQIPPNVPKSPKSPEMFGKQGRREIHAIS